MFGMPRSTPPDRLRALIAAAATTFVQHGVQRAQMDDIAAELGVSKGTIYRSVTSKESLLAAVLEFGDTPDQLPTGGTLEESSLDKVADWLRDALASAVAELQLVRVISEPSANLTSDEIGDQVEMVARDVFEVLAAHRVRIMVLDRCARELPDLGGDWYESGRYALVDLWDTHLGQLGAAPNSPGDRAVLARSIVELITIWAVKIHWDPAPHEHESDLASTCAGMVRNLVIGAL